MYYIRCTIIFLSWCGCCVCIDQASVGVIERCGGFERIAQPGFHCLNPFVGQCVRAILPTYITSFYLVIDSKTKDNVFVEMNCSVQYRVSRQNADDAFYELKSPKEQITDYVFDVVQSRVPAINYIELFERKDEVMGAYGYIIERVLITNIVRILDPAVRRVMNEINADKWRNVLDKISAELDTVKQMFRISEVFYNSDDKRTLLLRVHDEKIPISYNELYEVFSPFGNLKYVKVLSSSDMFHSRIGFEHEADAVRAINSLQGQYMYDGCCRMEIVIASNVDAEFNSGIHELGNSLTGADLTLQPPKSGHEENRQGDLIVLDEPPLPPVIGQGSTARNIAHENRRRDDLIVMDEPPLPPVIGQDLIAWHIAHENERRDDDLIVMDEPPLPPFIGYEENMNDMDEPPLHPVLGQGSIARHITHEENMQEVKMI